MEPGARFSNTLYYIFLGLLTEALLEPHFVIFKPLSYCFEETIGFDVKASFASRPLWRLIR